MLRTLIISAALLGTLAMPAPVQADAMNWAMASSSQDPRGRLTADQAREQSRGGAVLPSRRMIAAVRRHYPDMSLDDVALVMDGMQLQCPGIAGSGPRYLVKIRVAGARRINVVLNAQTAEILCER
jgi:hypothetical protein